MSAVCCGTSVSARVGRHFVGTVIRDDLAQAHRQSLADVAAPGSQSTAHRRLQIVVVARDAYLAADPSPPWVRPYGDAALDVAYRLARHAGTITQQWYEQIITEGMHPLEWVEVVGIVIATVPVVAFFSRRSVRRCRACPRRSTDHHTGASRRVGPA